MIGNVVDWYGLLWLLEKLTRFLFYFSFHWIHGVEASRTSKKCKLLQLKQIGMVLNA